MDFDANAINRNFKKFIGLTDEDDWDLEIDMSLLDNDINFSIYKHYINREKLIGQLEMHKKWGTNLNICILCSLYNSNPNLFYGDPKNIQKFIKKKNLSENIPIEIINFFNNRYHSNILEYHSNHIFDYIRKSIENNESPVLLRDSFLHESKHAVNVLNIDRDKIYYFENGKDSLINSIIKVYSELFIHNFKKLNSEFFNKYGINNIKKFLENNIVKLALNDNTTENEYYSLIRNFVDYKKEDNISEISIKYLNTSSKSLHVITFGDLNVKYDIDEYGEDSVCKPINEEVEFNELTKRLNRLNFSIGKELDDFIQKNNFDIKAYFKPRNNSLRKDKINGFTGPCYELDVYIKFLEHKNIDPKEFVNYITNGQNFRKLFIYDSNGNKLDDTPYYPLESMKYYINNYG